MRSAEWGSVLRFWNSRQNEQFAGMNRGLDPPEAMEKSSRVIHEPLALETNERTA
jgi:hypothetical protein